MCQSPFQMFTIAPTGLSHDKVDLEVPALHRFALAEKHNQRSLIWYIFLTSASFSADAYVTRASPVLSYASLIVMSLLRASIEAGLAKILRFMYAFPALDTSLGFQV